VTLRIKFCRVFDPINRPYPVENYKEDEERALAIHSRRHPECGGAISWTRETRPKLSKFSICY